MNLKYNTQLGYLYIMENRLKPHFGQYRLKSLTTAVIQEYVNQLKSTALQNLLSWESCEYYQPLTSML